MPARAATSPATLSLVWAAPARRLQFVAVISLVDFTNSHTSAVSPCLLPRPCTSSLSDCVVPTTSALTVPCEYARFWTNFISFVILFHHFLHFHHLRSLLMEQHKNPLCGWHYRCIRIGSFIPIPSHFRRQRYLRTICIFIRIEFSNQIPVRSHENSRIW